MDRSWRHQLDLWALAVVLLLPRRRRPLGEDRLQGLIDIVSHGLKREHEGRLVDVVQPKARVEILQRCFVDRIEVGRARNPELTP